MLKPVQGVYVEINNAAFIALCTRELQVTLSIVDHFELVFSSERRFDDFFVQKLRRAKAEAVEPVHPEAQLGAFEVS